MGKTNLNDVELQLYEALGILRLVGSMQPETKESAEMLRDQEAAVWAARAAERIIEAAIFNIDNLGE